jgi:hypothetical protein
MTCSFSIGDMVTWSDNAPKTWRFTWTSGPMTVVSVRWDDGTPSKYSERFGGISRIPGFIVTVEYDADSTDYYNPPRSLLFNKPKLQMEIHEKWLAKSYPLHILKKDGTEVVRTGTSREIAELTIAIEFAAESDEADKFPLQLFVPVEMIRERQAQIEAGTFGIKFSGKYQREESNTPEENDG